MMIFYHDNQQVFIILSVSFLYALIFSGYTLCNQYLLILYPNIGIYLSSILFCSMFICTIVSPYISHYLLSIKWTVIIGTFGTTIWLISFNFDNQYFIILATILSGIGSGLYRSHQFILIKKLYPENVSRNMSISLSVFNLYGVITSPIIFTMLFLNVSIHTILKYFAIIVFISQLILMLVKNVETDKRKLNYFDLFKTKIWLLLPLTLVQAINFTCYFVFIPKNMNEHFQSTIVLVATMALAYSLINPIATYLVGVLFNKSVVYRWFYFVISIFFSLILSALMIYMFYFHKQDEIYNYILMAMFGFLYGIYDSIIYTINMIIMGELFHENIFCVQRIFYCFIVTILVAIVKILNSYLFLMLLIFFNISSLIGYILLTSECQRKNREKYEEIVNTN